MMVMADINRESFSLPQVGSWYLRQRGLEPDEKAAFDWVIQHGPVHDLLDLGVGAGRTVEPLRHISTRYVGIDFSPAMIDLCRKRFPDTDFRVADARDLSVFPAASFDVVFFSFNGIDYVNHAGRLLILSEVHRILRPNGIFIFSAHNRDAKPKSQWHACPSGAPLQEQILRLRWIVLHLPWLLAGEFRHLWFRRFEVCTSEYEIRNDTAHAHRMMTYYIDAAKQAEQLRRFGFHSVEIFDTAGRQLDNRAKNDQSAWLCYLCRSFSKPNQKIWQTE